MEILSAETPSQTGQFDPCRLCLRRTCGTILLFESRLGDTPLIDVFQSVFRIKLPRDSDLPQYVCECCVRKIDCFQTFRQELVKCQAVLAAGRPEPGVDIAEEYLSDELFEQLEKLEEEIDCEEEHLEQVQSVEIEEIVLDQEQPSKKHLIDIKIEALGDNGIELFVERLSEAETDLEAEEEFLGFESPVPVKLEVVQSKHDSKTRQRKRLTEKLEVIETIPNKCYICNEVMQDEHVFDVHLGDHSDMLPYECDQCSTETNPIVIKTLRLLNKHFESHGFQFACPQCPLKFRSYPPLYDHTRNAHVVQKDYYCDICGLKFNEVRKFRKHVLAHKNRQLERYKCETCGKSFQTSTVLRRHERIHSKEMPFTCTFCGRGFNHESNFQQHKARHIQQQKELDKGYPCTVCELHFTNTTDLHRHLAEHFPDNPLYTTKLSQVPQNLKDAASYPRPCQEPNCQYVAPSYTLMWSHYRNHYKSYQCTECDRKFGTATILRKHVEVAHLKLRKYNCEFCEKTFAYQHKYKEHMDGHRGIKPRKCRYCEKTFTHSSNLVVHERIHTSTKPYHCLECGSRHVTSSALKKHQRTHQKKSKPEEPSIEDGQEEYLGMVHGDDGLLYLMDAVEEIQHVEVGEEEVVVN